MLHKKFADYVLKIKWTARAKAMFPKKHSVRPRSILKSIDSHELNEKIAGELLY